MPSPVEVFGSEGNAVIAAILLGLLLGWVVAKVIERR